MAHVNSAGAPIESKVKVPTVVTYLGLVAVMAVLNAVADANLIANLPDVVEVFVAPILPAVLTFVSGYLAKHTPRNDPQARGEVGHL